MKRLAILTVAFALLVTACGSQGAVPVGPVATGSPAASPEPSVPPEQSLSPEPSPTSGKTFTYELWFALPNELGGPYLFVTSRTEPFTPGVGRAALTALLAGPNELERSVDVGTAVPTGTRLLGLDIDGGIATVDLSGAFESGGGTASTTMRLAQVVYTLTQFPTVKGVRFRLDGRPVSVFGGEGIVLDRPATRKDYEALLPPILVEDPSVGERVESGLMVSGSANTFEANVRIRVVDGRGKILADTFTTATCGTGCRGTFEERVRFRRPSEPGEAGEIVVFESSAMDGSMINVVRIPIVLG